jgi:hypothetical protein
MGFGVQDLGCGRWVPLGYPINLEGEVVHVPGARYLADASLPQSVYFLQARVVNIQGSRGQARSKESICP